MKPPNPPRADAEGPNNDTAEFTLASPKRMANRFERPRNSDRRIPATESLPFPTFPAFPTVPTRVEETPVVARNHERWCRLAKRAGKREENA